MKVDERIMPSIGLLLAMGGFIIAANCIESGNIKSGKIIIKKENKIYLDSNNDYITDFTMVFPDCADNVYNILKTNDKIKWRDIIDSPVINAYDKNKKLIINKINGTYSSEYIKAQQKDSILLKIRQESQNVK